MKKKDRGVAIITVLMSLAVIMVMVTSIVISGKLTYKTALVAARSHRNQYIAESQLSRSIWDLVYDLKINTNRQLGFDSGLETGEEEVIRYQADGKPHVRRVDGDRIVTVVFDDAAKGFDFSGTMTSAKIQEIKYLIKLPAEADPEPVDNFLNKLIDYTDRDDLFREEGAEKEQYEDEIGFDLPRNAPLEFAEEALWIPGIEDALFAQREYLEDFNPETFDFKIVDYLRVVPYRGVSFPKTSRPSFFAATDYQIYVLAELTEEEMAQVREARQLWFTENTNIKDQIPDIYTKLSRYFSFNESGIYRIRVQVSDSDTGAVVYSEAILNLSRTLPRYREDTFSGMRFWRKVNF